MRELTLPQARRIALAAQGFATPRPAPGHVTTRHLQSVVATIGVVQIDSVNVLTRSHYLPFFSRLGPYDRGALDRMRDVAPRRLVEYWAHEAALISPAIWPLFAGRMHAAEAEAWGGMRQVRDEQPGLVEAVLDEVNRRGPMTSREVEAALAHDAPRSREEWGWNWSEVKRALEWLFWSGQVASAGRTTQFERRYAALDRVAPAPHRAAWAARGQDRTETEAIVELVRIASRAMGIATEASLADYFRLTRAQARTAIADLLREGTLQEVSVPGWRDTAYLDSRARIPRKVHVAALVSPFDSLVWHRPRTEALFGVRYRIEIYTPAQQRVHGYYVLPFVYGDTIVARVDLKADRPAGVLRVPQLTWEPGAPPEAAEALAGELASLAAWLHLAEVAKPANLRIPSSVG
jgi:uncharacterized protein YcaQ